ncbi:hypothetical protein [Rathayibacter oskolensis]|uniref:hypothetical protein n=1 Tax=Rathayibacter oskolensis TaxID=1891671 RepID=UPI0034650191
MRIREAQSRCTGLTVLPYDPVLDHRAFEPLVQALEEITPGVQLIRPGLCAIRARGPRRYYGNERSAAEAVLRRLAELGVARARIGIADGLFASELAAKHSGEPVAIVPAGETAGFLSPLPLDALETEAVAMRSRAPRQRRGPGDPPASTRSADARRLRRPAARGRDGQVRPGRSPRAPPGLGRRDRDGGPPAAS